MPLPYDMYLIISTPHPISGCPLSARIHLFPHPEQPGFIFRVLKNENHTLQMRENVVFIFLGLAYLS